MLALTLTPHSPPLTHTRYTGLGVVFINAKILPNTTIWQEASHSLAAYVSAAGSYENFMNIAWGAFTIGYDAYGRKDHKYEDGLPNNWEQKFEKAFAFCDGKCSIYRNTLYGVDHSVNANYYQLKESCNDSFLMQDNAWDAMRSNAPRSLIEDYYTCKQTPTQAMLSSVGVSVGNTHASLFIITNVSFSVLCPA